MVPKEIGGVEHMLAFIIWALMGVAFIVLGIYALFSKSARPLGFWSNAKTLPMKDVKGYNRAMSILYIVLGVLFILIGLPLLFDAKGAGLIIPILGAMFLSIGSMVVYVTVIEKKYKA